MHQRISARHTWAGKRSGSSPTNLVILGDECVREESPSEIVADCLEINSNYHDLNS